MDLRKHRELPSSSIMPIVRNWLQSAVPRQRLKLPFAVTKDAILAREYGEVVVRGGMVMKEYWRRPTLTEATLRTAGFIGRLGLHGCRRIFLSGWSFAPI